MKIPAILMLFFLAYFSSSSCMERGHYVAEGDIEYLCDERKKLFVEKANKFLQEASVHFHQNNPRNTVRKDIQEYLLKEIKRAHRILAEGLDEQKLLEMCPCFSWEVLYKKIDKQLKSGKIDVVAKEKKTTPLDILFFEYVYSILNIQKPSNFRGMSRANQNEYSRIALFSISKKLAITVLPMLGNMDFQDT